MLVFIAIAVGLMSVWYLYHALLPLTEAGTITASEWERIEDESVRLLERRDLLIAELKDLEFEAALNKVGDRDLEALRARYEAEALEVVRQLDAQAEQYTDRIDEDVADRIAAAKARRAAQGVPPPEPVVPAPAVDAPAADASAASAPAADASAEAEASVASAAPAAAQDAAPKGADGLTCPACDAAVLADANFCDACGTGLGAVCSACGVMNRAQAKFCKGCGAGLEAEA